MSPSLTDRQREIAALVGHGYSNGEIASRLVLTPGSASNHVHHIMLRLGFHSRAQIAVWAERQGLLGDGSS